MRGESQRRIRGIAGCVITLIVIGALGVPCAARDHVDGFDTATPSWRIKLDPKQATILGHRRNERERHSGTAAEHFEIQCTGNSAIPFECELNVPASRLLEEWRLSLWVKSNRTGLGLSVRVVFPYQKHPTGNGALTLILDGDEYKTAGVWQELSIRDLEPQIRRHLPQLYNRLGMEGTRTKEFDSRELYVDRVILRGKVSRGATEVLIDDLEFGPVVPPSALEAVTIPTTKPTGTGTLAAAGAPSPLPNRTGTQLASATAGSRFTDDTGLRPRGEAGRLQMRLDRLLLDGKPYFPRVVPLHGEDPAELARMRFNLVWIPDFQDFELQRNLAKAGLFAMATPPRAVNEEGAPVDARTAGLTPFGPETERIVMWNLGTRIPPAARAALASWTEQVRDADRVYHRPVTGDIVSNERSFSRDLTPMAVSRTPLHSDLTMKGYRDWLIERRHLSQPGSTLWTWILTEPVSSTIDDREAMQVRPIVVEPEQLRLQTYATLAAGYRGIGYWTLSPLDEDTPAARERKLALSLLNMELELLEPFLATSVLQSQSPFSAKLPPGTNVSQWGLDFGPGAISAKARAALLNEKDNQNKQLEQLPKELEAALLRTDYGLLLLPVWYGSSASFVPGQMAANDATVVVAGADESSSAWEITSTAIRSLERKRVTGGIQITLPQFDVATAVVLTSDRGLVDLLREKVESQKEASAKLSLELAKLKLERVTDVDRQLQKLGVGQSDSRLILERARGLLRQANDANSRRDFHTARLQCTGVMQLLRILQHAYWSDTVRTLSGPTASPHTACFNTLPDHWEMLARLGRSTPGQQSNLLRSGGFEDFDAMIAEGWRHEQKNTPGIRATAELYPRPKTGEYCLRLIAAPTPGEEPPASLSERPVTVTSPPLPVRKRQIVYVGGFVKVVAPTLASQDGAMVYDSVAGPSGAVRWRNVSPNWQQFSLLREIPESGDFTLTFTLGGMGEVYFDDIRVIAHNPVEAPSEAKSDATADPQKSRPFDFLRRFTPFPQRSK